MLAIAIIFGFFFTIILTGIGIYYWMKYSLKYLIEKKEYISIIGWCFGALIVISFARFVACIVLYCIWAFMYTVYAFITV